MSRAVLGLDVGGANLKAAWYEPGQPEVARSQPFALWKGPSGLADALRGLIASLPAAGAVAVTMTGELCDCFESKRQGVGAILDAVEAVAGGLPLRVYGTDGRFTSLEEARAAPLRTASANWLALAAFAGRFAPQGPALLIDVGSTTTDIVPLIDGQPRPQGTTDLDRMRYKELVYFGVRRTPLCALMARTVAAELFATALDAYLILGMIPEEPDNHDTADGRPATLAAAHARIARAICTDLETSTESMRLDFAHLVLIRQLMGLENALGAVAERLPGQPRTVILAGEGEFLALHGLRAQDAFPPCPLVSLGRRLGAAVSRAACAYAVAVLAAEQAAGA